MRKHSMGGFVCIWRLMRVECARYLSWSRGGSRRGTVGNCLALQLQFQFQFSVIHALD